jgi:hypothetical protein
MGAFESGQSFIAGVLAKLPAELQAQAKAVFDAAEAKDAVTLLGDGTLARSDYSRNMDTLREKETSLTEYYQKLDGWYKDNEAALKAAREGAVRPGNGNGNGDHPPAGDKPALQTPAVTAAEMRKIADDAINEAGRDYIAVSGFIATQAGWHQHVFGEPLDMTELVNNPKLGRPIVGQPGRVFSLQDAYHEKYGERIAAKNKEAEDKRINDEVDKRFAERTRQSAGQPFPLRSEASPLDVLTTKDGTAAHTLDSAVAEYERLVAAKQT